MGENPAEVRPKGRQFQVGDRIESVRDRARGTVRYCGPVTDPASLYVGVEWDDPQRGKHDGAFRGRRYFGPTLSERGGSLVPVEQCGPEQSLWEAAVQRYWKGQDGGLEGRFVVVKNSMESPGFHLPVEFVGEQKVKEKIAEIEKLERIGLQGSLVNTIEDDRKWEMKALDVQETLLSRWEEIEKLQKIAPKLEELRLSGNLMCEGPNFKGRFDSLRVLMLNKMKPNGWLIAQRLARTNSIPCLEELFICANGLTSLALETEDEQEIETLFPKLTLLDLTDNALKEWSEVMRLSKLPELQTLSLDGNQINDIQGLTSFHFPALKTLCVYRNPLKSLSSLEQLNHLIELRSLRLLETTLHDSLGNMQMRQLTIAMIANLKILTRSEIGLRERQDAEQFYLKYFRDYDRQNEPCLQLERFPILQDIYGKPLKSDSSSNASKTSIHVAEITFRSNEASTITKPAVKKKVPTHSFTVGAAKQLCQRLYQIAPEDQKLFYQHETGSFPQPLDDELRVLDFYGVAEGGTVIMEKNITDQQAHLERFR